MSGWGLAQTLKGVPYTVNNNLSTIEFYMALSLRPLTLNINAHHNTHIYIHIKIHLYKEYYFTGICIYKVIVLKPLYEYVYNMYTCILYTYTYIHVCLLYLYICTFNLKKRAIEYLYIFIWYKRKVRRALSNCITCYPRLHSVMSEESCRRGYTLPGKFTTRVSERKRAREKEKDSRWTTESLRL